MLKRRKKPPGFWFKGVWLKKGMILVGKTMGGTNPPKIEVLKVKVKDRKASAVVLRYTNRDVGNNQWTLTKKEMIESQWRVSQNSNGG